MACAGTNHGLENLMKNYNCIQKNSVKGTRNSVSLGRDTNVAQVGPDRHPATVAKNKKNIRKRWKKNTTYIATWNVRTLFQKGKLDNVVMEMNRMKLKILGLAEMRWNGNGSFKKDGHTVLYSGNNKHTNGVGFIVHRSLNNNIKGFYGISDRVALLKISSRYVDMCLLQVYAPTSESADEELAQFYSQLEEGMKQCKSNELLLVMGDFNAKVGSEKVEHVIGSHGLGAMNERGRILQEWCYENELCIMNTWFQKKDEKLWTWRRADGIIKNQIDFILIQKRFFNAILDVKSCSNADCGSDHNPVVAKIRLRLKVIHETSTYHRIDWDKCTDEEKSDFRQRFMEKIDGSLENYTVQDCFHCISDALESATEPLPIWKKPKHKGWVTPEIEELMKRRREVKISNNEREYADLNREIRTKCSQAKENYLNDKCLEMEEIYNVAPKVAHQKIREITGKYKGQNGKHGCIIDESGNIIMETKDILERWGRYIKELYDDPKRTNIPISFEGDLSGPEILELEIEQAVKQLKVGKATGPDNNQIYNQGVLPEEMCQSVFVPLPKKPGTLLCEEHRTISLMSHLTKVMLKVLGKRIKPKIETELNVSQFGFRSDCGTRNAVFVLKKHRSKIN